MLARCGIDGGELGGRAAAARAEQVCRAVEESRLDPAGAPPGADIAGVLDEHLRSEFERHDADATMATMTDDPYLNHVPVMTGGRGSEDVRRFYADHFIPGWPADTSVEPISRTVGAHRVVDELVVSFTHDG